MSDRESPRVHSGSVHEGGENEGGRKFVLREDISMVILPLAHDFSTQQTQTSATLLRGSGVRDRIRR